MSPQTGMPSQRDKQTADRPSKDEQAVLLRRVIGFSVLASLALAVGYSLISGYFTQYNLNPKAFADFVLSLGGWGYGAVIGLMIIHAFVPFPAEMVAVAAGMCYGLFLGTLLTWIGAMLGAALSFALSRYAGRSFVEHALGAAKFKKLDALAQTKGPVALLLSRFIPLIAFNLINYAAGLTRVSWGVFLWTTGLGILPLTILMVAMGEQMRDPTWRDWVMFAIAGAALLAFALIFKRARQI